MASRFKTFSKDGIWAINEVLSRTKKYQKSKFQTNFNVLVVLPMMNNFIPFVMQISRACPAWRWRGIQQDKFPWSKNRKIYVYYNHSTVEPTRAFDGPDISHSSHHSI